MSGTAHLDRCRFIIEELDDAERALRGQTGALRGEMVVAAPIVFGRLHVLPIVTALLRWHAELSVRLILADRNAHVAEDGIDVAIRIGVLADSSLIGLRLCTMGTVVVASPEYLAAHPAPARVADLAHHSLIAFEGLGQPSEWRFSDETVRVRPRLSVTTAEAAIAAAEAGLGSPGPSPIRSMKLCAPGGWWRCWGRLRRRRCRLPRCTRRAGGRRGMLPLFWLRLGVILKTLCYIIQAKSRLSTSRVSNNPRMTVVQAEM